jgi:hypothetical protein
MNQDILIKLVNGLKEIQKLSFPLCEHDDTNISSKCAKINNEARNLKVMLEYFFGSQLTPPG